TATPVGDREEILSLRAVFGDRHHLRLGSLKAQMGHLITASAGAGLLKLCGAFETDTLPPAPATACASPLREIAESALALDPAATTWRPGERARRAAVDAFGFGGCNAHAILEGPEGVEDLVKRRRARRGVSAAIGAAEQRADDLVVVACEIAVGEASDLAATLRVFTGRDAPTRRLRDLRMPLRGLGFPPADLRHALPQQLLLLRAAQALKLALDGLDRSRVGVFVGTDVDPAGARHGCRWRLDRWLGRPATDAERDAVAPPLEAAAVLGTMPNMPANRLNSALDLGGAGLVLSDGEGSGGWALSLASDAIAHGELDGALVGAVDASGGAFGDDPECADTVVLLLVLAASHAGDRPVLARLTRSAIAGAVGTPHVPWADNGTARELADIAVATLCCHHALQPDAPALPWSSAERACRVNGWTVVAQAPAVGLSDEPPAVARIALASPAKTPTGGETGGVALVFTGAGAAYPGAGRAMWQAIPALGADLAARAPRLAAELPRLLSGAPLSLLDQLQLATLLSQSHAQLLAWLGLRPDAMLGLSSGETNALLASGAWSDPDELFSSVEESGMYDRHLAGEHRTLRAAWGLGPGEPVEWCCYRVWHPVAAVRKAVAATVGRAPRDAVRLLIVHHSRDVVIGGDDAACRALIAKLGARSIPLGHDLLVHCPELGPFAAEWYAVHHRPTRAITTPRLYANAINAAFTPTSERCATLLLEQARDTAVFDATVEQAYADGVRVFIEVGPRAACTSWIGEILGDRPHCAVALDGTHGLLRDVAGALTRLTEAGVAVDVARWNGWMEELRSIGEPARSAPAAAAPATIALGGHRPPPHFVTAPEPSLVMAHAPRLAPVLPERLQVVAASPPLAPQSAGPPLPAASRGVAPTARAASDLIQASVGIPYAPSVLAALADTQAALLRAQEMFVRIAQTVRATETSRLAEEDTAPLFTREDLEYLSHGRVSSLFGPAFAAQAEYPRQVRMPMPPLLLADRVLAIDAVPASLTTGTIWTETDIGPDAWYLHAGRMPAGIVIESGQADLLLISWLGIDLANRGERIYRLLGCELTFAGRLPTVGETLRYEISISGHARHGDVGLFFFHYDCTVGDALRLRVREGQAGFFTDEELAQSAGILWDPAEDVPDAAAPLAGPRLGISERSAYDEAAVSAFATGDLVTAFGDAFLRTASHTRTPRIPSGRMQLFTRVDELDLHGGPWQRGYLRASLPITPDSWFFAGHFHNDPCMPGTLMFEGCLQTMTFYLAALGYTVDRDGWTFEPVPDRPYKLRCRGQVTPQSRLLTYEVFVSEVHDGPEPTLVADLLCTVDGLKAFHCRRMALRLAPDFPLGAHELAA
ncbi:MAG: beta-ketoacyl synthase N-terminal-like domain-containing protein, partial [Gemmatimonadales bacterium]